jgi:hypothetical protein
MVPVTLEIQVGNVHFMRKLSHYCTYLYAPPKGLIHCSYIYSLLYTVSGNASYGEEVKMASSECATW